MLLNLLCRIHCFCVLSMVYPTWHTQQMVKKGGTFAVRIFPEGLLLSQDCPNLLKLKYIFSFIVLWKTCESYPYLPVTHCSVLIL